MSDMTRKNENPSNNAGARFVKCLQEAGFDNLDIMIFTSSTNSANTELKKLGVKMNNKIKVTTSSNNALKFLISE